MNTGYLFDNAEFERERHERERYERERHERDRYERERYGNLSSYENDRDNRMLEHIAHLEQKCKMLERQNNRSNEEVLYNMDISVIEKFLRQKKLQQLNNL